jgi:hypothetical protein
VRGRQSLLGGVREIHTRSSAAVSYGRDIRLLHACGKEAAFGVSSVLSADWYVDLPIVEDSSLTTTA